MTRSIDRLCRTQSHALPAAIIGLNIAAGADLIGSISAPALAVANIALGLAYSAAVAGHRFITTRPPSPAPI